MSFRFVPKSVTLNDLERRNGGMVFILRYPTEFAVMSSFVLVLVQALSGLGLCLDLYCHALCFWSQNCIGI